MQRLGCSAAVAITSRGPARRSSPPRTTSMSLRSATSWPPPEPWSTSASDCCTWPRPTSRRWPSTDRIITTRGDGAVMPRATRAEVPKAWSRAGLTTPAAEEILARHGPNQLPAAHRPHLVTRVVGQLRDPMIMMLCAAWAVVLAIGDREDATIIAAVVVLNTVIGVVQEVRAQRAVDALTLLASPHAHVRRDGVVVEVSAADVVPGDLVRLEAGDVVPADLVLTESSALQVDESAMTGESAPVDRAVDDEVLAGTVV